MTKDRNGNNVSYSKVSGFSSHSDGDREQNDYYATDPKAVVMLLELETFGDNIRECACGEGHLSKELERVGKKVRSTDIVDRGFGDKLDFLKYIPANSAGMDYDIITNPPYKYADEFIERSLQLIKKGNKVALFLPIRYLEGKSRKKLFADYPPKTIYVSSSRIKCAINGEFHKVKSSAVCYAWFVWEKGHKEDTLLRWFN